MTDSPKISSSHIFYHIFSTGLNLFRFHHISYSSTGTWQTILSPIVDPQEIAFCHLTCLSGYPEEDKRSLMALMVSQVRITSGVYYCILYWYEAEIITRIVYSWVLLVILGFITFSVIGSRSRSHMEVDNTVTYK